MQDDRETTKLRRRTVLISAVGSISLIGTTRWTQAGTKVPQSAVYYQAAPKDGQDCGHCAQFAAPHSCKLVDGDISPSGWCRLWVKKTA